MRGLERIADDYDEIARSLRIGSKGLRAMANGQADREIRKALYDAIRANLALESLLRRKSLRIRSLIRRAVKNGVNVGSSPGGGQ